MNKFHFVILLLIAFGCLLTKAKKEEKTAVAKANTNLVEYVQLFKSLLNQALSRADFSSVRGMLSSPLSIGATAISVLLGGIVLMAFYESPLSPLPVPPLPQPPVGRFPPENPMNVVPMNNGIHRLSSSSAMNFLNPEHLALRDQRRRMIYSPQNQPFFYPKSGQPINYPNIKRSGNNNDFERNYYSYVNQMVKNLNPTNMNVQSNKFQPADQEADLAAPSSVDNSNFKKDKSSKNNENLQASETSGIVSFAAPLATNQDSPKINSHNKPNINSSTNQLNNQFYNKNSVNQIYKAFNDFSKLDIQNKPDMKIDSDPKIVLNSEMLKILNKSKLSNNLNNQLNTEQSNPAYKHEESLNENVHSNNFAIKEENFDQRQVVNSQLSQIEFKTSPELARLEENLKRSSE